jgi:small nuclear ribonucleoprotein (snRNP)-like protein
MLFHGLFQTLRGKEIVVELKNDLSIRGTLVSVDQFLNIRLDGITVSDEAKFPHLAALRTCFIRGSVVRYVQLPPEHVDIEFLHDATRKELKQVQATL